MGKIFDKNYFKELKLVINKYNLQDRFLFLGELPRYKLPYFYSICLFFISASACEIFSQVLVEAMSCGAPIVCSYTTAMPEICGDAALYFNPDDINDIAEKMMMLIKNVELRKN